jgi:hypothetical protein
MAAGDSSIALLAEEEAGIGDCITFIGGSRAWTRHSV